MKVKTTISKSYTHAEALKVRDRQLEVGQSIGFTISLDSETHNRILVFAHGNNPNHLQMTRSGAVQLLLKLGMAQAASLLDEEEAVKRRGPEPSDTSQSTTGLNLGQKESEKSPQTLPLTRQQL